jgi:hypothetical protein
MGRYHPHKVSQTIAAHASDRNPGSFPLQVQIVYRHGHRHHHGYFAGEGKGNLIQGNQINGMEFSFACEYKFNDSEADEVYPARWKKEGLTLDILMGEMGSETRTHTCQLKIALKDVVYRKVKGQVVGMSPQEYASLDDARIEHEQSLAPLDLDPSHYPIQFMPMHLNWTGTVNGMHTGAGQGNIRTPNGLNAVDFSLHCPVVIQTTPEGRYLVGRWVQPGTSMLLLLRSIDVDGAPGATCDVMTAVGPDVYVRSGNGVKAISQQEYQQKYSAADGPPAQ